MLKIRFISDKIDKNCSHMLKSLLASRFHEELCEPIKLSSFCSIITSHLELLSGERSRNIPSHNSCYLARFRIILITSFHPNWEKTNDLMTNLHQQTPHSLTLPSHGGFNSPFSPGNPTDPRPPVPSTQVLLSTLFRRRIKIGALWRWSWIVSSCGSSH